RRFRIAEIGVHYARTAAPDLADLAVLAPAAVFSPDLDIHVRQRLSAINDGAIAGGAREVALAAGKALLLHQLHADAFSGWHHRHRQCRLGQAIARREGGRAEAGGSKSVDEALHHV